MPVLKILITAKNTFTGADLKIGSWYNAEPAAEGTLAQNSTFHSLLTEYWRSGCHSYNVTKYEDFRDCIKRDLGAGFETYTRDYTRSGKPCDPFTDSRLKSWSDYTKKERMETIDRLIAEMHQAQVQTKHFYEILQGMESMKIAG